MCIRDTTHALQQVCVFGTLSVRALPLRSAVLAQRLKSHVVHSVYSGTELSSPSCCEPEDTRKRPNMPNMEWHFEPRSGSYILRPVNHMAEDHRGLPVHDHAAKDCRRMALDVVGSKDTVGIKTVCNERSHQLPSCNELSEEQDGREKAVGRCSEMEAAPARRSSQDMSEHTEMESGSEA